jgi:hypothetical protein
MKEIGADTEGDDGDNEEKVELAVRYLSRAAAAGARCSVLLDVPSTDLSFTT